MAEVVRITPDQRKKERAVGFAVAADLTILVGFALVGLLGGSLTILAELVRGSLMTAIEGFSLVVMRRVHRGMLTELEFGAGKLEQFANLLIAAGMIGGALWIALGAWAMATGHREPGSQFGLALAAIAGAVNTYVNVLAWDVTRKAALTGNSLIMQGQLKVRTVKLLSSLIVQLTMTIAAVSNDAVVAAWADSVGSLVVAALIFASGVQMFRAGLPDLLDRAAEEEVQIAINRALAGHFDAYDRLDRVRSRRSGGLVFVEIGLGFAADLTIAEIERRIASLNAAMRNEIARADIAILISAHP